jgi:hypothetical protein
MESKVTQKIREKLQKIIKGPQNHTQESAKNIQDLQKTPKFPNELKLPAITSNRSHKVLQKPYPVSKIDFSPGFKESSSLLHLKNSPYRVLKRPTNIEIQKNKSSTRVEKKIPTVNKNNELIQTGLIRPVSKRSKLVPISYTPEPFDANY